MPSKSKLRSWKVISTQLSEGKCRVRNSSKPLITILWKYYAYILAEDQGKDRPEGEYSCISKLKIGVEDWYSHIVKDA
jgi:hypothetical protein